MTIITMPSAGVRGVSWSLNDQVEVNRSDWTGNTEVNDIGPPPRWTAKVTIVPGNEAMMLKWRAFGAQTRGRRNIFKLPAVERAQTATTGAQVNGSGQTGRTLNLKGLPVLTTVLVAGRLVAIDTAAGSASQLFELAADLVTDSGGLATATFSTPIRPYFVDGQAVELANPYGLMRMTDVTRGWDVDIVTYTPASFSCEECF